MKVLRISTHVSRPFEDRPTLPNTKRRVSTPALVAVLFSVLAAGLILSCTGPRKVASSTAQDQFDRAKNRFDTRRFLDSTEQFKLLLEQYPGSKFVEPATFYLGMCYYETKEYPLAEVQFEKILRDFPRGEHAEESSFMVAMCEFKQRRSAPYDQTQTERAIQLLDAYLSSFPDGAFVEKADGARRECRTTLAQKLYLTGKLYLKLKDPEASRLCFKEVLDKYDETKWADMALVGIGQSYEKEHNWKMASESYRNVLARNGDREARDEAMERLKKVSDKTGD